MSCGNDGDIDTKRRNRALLGLLAGLGLRVGEALALIAPICATTAGTVLW